MPTRGEDIAWAAGLFEGEGTISVPPGRPRSVVLKVDMTDRDVLERFTRIVGVSHVRATHSSNPLRGSKPQWRWFASSSTDVLRILRMFLPYLGERRTAKAQEAIARLDREMEPTLF